MLHRRVLLSMLLLLSSSVFSVSLQEITESATGVANNMEEYRQMPSSVTVETQTLNSAQALALFSGTICYLHDSTTGGWNYIPEIYPPADVYPDVMPTDNLFDGALTVEGYVDICDVIHQLGMSIDSLPDRFAISGDTLRYPEALHLAASILRFRHFYGYLPEVHELMVVCSKGLTPLETPTGYEEYTSMITGWTPSNFIRYNYYNVGKYSMFKQAQDIVEAETDYYQSGGLIYDWIKAYWYQAGYFIYIRTFGSRMSADEHLRHNLQNSAFHFQDMNGLMRSLGMSVSEYTLYDPDKGDWINTNIHCAYGSDPTHCVYSGLPHIPPWDNLNAPSPTDDFVTQIREILTQAASYEVGFRSIWINPADIEKYGAAQIVSAARAGGFTTIILTVKTELGNLYFPTDSFPDQFAYDALTPLVNAAADADIDIYAAVSVLADRHTLSAHMDWRQMNEIDPDPGYFYPNVSISPCVDEYRMTSLNMVKEFIQLPGISGIILVHLFWDTCNYAKKMGGNPACSTYQGYTNWQQNCLAAYLEEHVDTIRAIRPDIEISVASYPIAVSRVNDFCGHQDIVAMSMPVDRVYLIYDGNYWLVEQTEFSDPPPILPDPFDLEANIAHHASMISAPIVVSVNLTDEWAFPPRFYNGLHGLALTNGADGINLHSPVSMLGEYGEAFTRSQYDKIAATGFYSDPIYMCGDANGDATINVGDAVHLITYIFKGGPAPDPAEAGDANCDGVISIADAVCEIDYVFQGGPEPCCP